MKKFRKLLAEDIRDVLIEEVNFEEKPDPEEDSDCWRLGEEGF